MAAYFIESSGLVKRYTNETGSKWIKSLVDPAAANRLYVANITKVEVISALMRRGREGSLTPADLHNSIREIGVHFNIEYRVLEVTDSVIALAVELVQRHVLRAYDAVQLSIALETVE